MAAMWMGRAAATVAAVVVVALTACSSGSDDETGPAASPSATETTAAPEGAADFLQMLDEFGGTEGVPETEVVDAGQRYCAWISDGGSEDRGRDPKTLDLPDYFTPEVMKDIAFTAPRTLCRENLG